MMLESTVVHDSVPEARRSSAGGHAAGGAAAHQPAVSFVVIAYNEQRHIARTIESICAQVTAHEFEIVVVDDGSSDETASVVESLIARHDNLRLIRHRTNRGRGAARQTGVGNTVAALVAMVDADIVLPTDWLSTCVNALGHNDAVGGVAVPDGDVGYIYRRYGFAPKVVGATTTITGNNGLYKKAALDRSGFDPDLAEGEDVALNHAFVSSGLQLACLNELIVRHEEDKGYWTSLRWLFQSGVGASRQLYRYREVRMPDIATAGFVAVVAVAGAGGRRHRSLLILFPGYLLALSVLHLRTKFVLGDEPRRRVGSALSANATLLLAYQIGRIVGSVRYAGELSGTLRQGSI